MMGATLPLQMEQSKVTCLASSAMSWQIRPSFLSLKTARPLSPPLT